MKLWRLAVVLTSLVGVVLMSFGYEPSRSPEFELVFRVRAGKVDDTQRDDTQRQALVDVLRRRCGEDERLRSSIVPWRNEELVVRTPTSPTATELPLWKRRLGSRGELSARIVADEQTPNFDLAEETSRLRAWLDAEPTRKLEEHDALVILRGGALPVELEFVDAKPLSK